MIIASNLLITLRRGTIDIHNNYETNHLKLR